MGVRLNDEKKIGCPSIPEGKARKIKGVFGGVSRVLANSNPVLQKEKLVMGQIRHCQDSFECNKCKK